MYSFAEPQCLSIDANEVAMSTAIMVSQIYGLVLYYSTQLIEHLVRTNYEISTLLTNTCKATITFFKDSGYAVAMLNVYVGN